MWKDINETNGKYSVSIYGEIRNNKTKEILKGSHVGKSKKRDRVPYKCHGLMINGVRSFQLTHRIVASHFVPNPLNKPFVNHINEDVKDNRAENLEWVDNKENSRHSNKRTIIQMSLDGIVVNEYTSLYELGDLGFNKSSLCCALYRSNNIYKGFRWRYKDA